MRVSLWLAVFSLAIACGSGAQVPPAQPLAIGETFTIPSKILGEERRINVYVPPSSSEVRLPVLYMPDGGVAEDFIHVAGLVQVLVGNGTMRPFLLVGIENTERRRDLTGPTGNADDRKIAPRVGGSAKFRAFLRDELIPQVEKRYRTTGERAIVGESLAGLFVVETLVLQPELFDTYIAFDPSLWWNDGKLVGVSGKRLRGKTLFVATSDEPGILQATRQFIRTLGPSTADGLRWHYEPMPEEQHSTIYHPAALQAFRALFPPAAKESEMSENKKTVERYMEGFRRSDHAQILACLTDDVEWILPGAFHLHGKEAFDKEIENDAFTGSPEIEVRRLTEEGDVVIAEGTVRARRRDGTALLLAMCDVFELREHKIQRLTSYLMEVK